MQKIRVDPNDKNAQSEEMHLQLVQSTGDINYVKDSIVTNMVDKQPDAQDYFDDFIEDIIQTLQTVQGNISYTEKIQPCI